MVGAGKLASVGSGVGGSSFSRITAVRQDSDGTGGYVFERITA